MKTNNLDKNNFENNIPQKERRFLKVRKIKDIFSNTRTILFSIFTFSILIWMIVYVFQNGGKLLTWDFITRDYNEHAYTIKTKDGYENNGDLTFENKDNVEAFSTKWGVGFKDGKNGEDDVVFVVTLDPNSPFNDLVDYNNNGVKINLDYYFSSLTLIKNDGDIEVLKATDGAKKFATSLDDAVSICFGTLTSQGKGIRSSLLTTLYLIAFSLLFSLPLGIATAIYLAVYAGKNKTTKFIRSLIDVTSGIPSIIFGLAGAIIFIPIVNKLSHTNGGSIFSGSLTLAIMLLPTIVKTVEESIYVIPKSLSQASLALGANQTQTVFKIILPNALPGILTSTLLSIGRIIGESAALIFSMGAIIGDNVDLLKGNASLAVHIWTALQGETPQYGNACAISIIILGVVLILSIIVKLISMRLYKSRGIK